MRFRLTPDGRYMVVGATLLSALMSALAVAVYLIHG